MKKLLVALSALSVSVAVSGCSMDHNPPPPPPHPMAQDDWGHRGWDHKEHMKMMTEYFFNKMDKNGDGYVSRKEYDEYYRKWFHEADTNHDGRLTIEEVRAQMHREMKRMKQDMEEMHSKDDDNRSSNDSNYTAMSPSSGGDNADNADSNADSAAPHETGKDSGQY
jgi:hypothetical protein